MSMPMQVVRAAGRGAAAGGGSAFGFLEDGAQKSVIRRTGGSAGFAAAARSFSARFSRKVSTCPTNLRTFPVGLHVMFLPVNEDVMNRPRGSLN